MPEQEAFWSEMTVEDHVEHYIALGLSKMDACKQAAKDRGVGKGEIYKIINR
jgi:16S rRNA (cytidine1402-2'-O)-methyltransferase